MIEEFTEFLENQKLKISPNNRYVTIKDFEGGYHLLEWHYEWLSDLSKLPGWNNKVIIYAEGGIPLLRGSFSSEEEENLNRFYRAMLEEI